ncbi:hypothetical protein [Streptomyces sp. NBC_01563]|uniref:hypothetical protein n=1 Tax=Streptomyces sp. NBC_01563 TaxID=2975880 RepID=UPI00386F33F5
MYGLLRRWQRDGTWYRILEQLQANTKDLITWDVSVGSTAARARRHAATTRKPGISRSSRTAWSPPSPTTTRSDPPGAS